jgi:hypothetical protein
MPSWASYSWAVVVNLFTVAVAIAIYGRVAPGFQTIIASLLVLIYLSIQSFSVFYSSTNIDSARGLDEEFKRIRKLLHDEPDAEEIETFKDLEKLLTKAKVKTCINVAGQIIIYAITLFNLFAQL